MLLLPNKLTSFNTTVGYFYKVENTIRNTVEPLSHGAGLLATGKKQ